MLQSLLGSVFVTLHGSNINSRIYYDLNLLIRKLICKQLFATKWLCENKFIYSMCESFSTVTGIIPLLTNLKYFFVHFVDQCGHIFLILTQLRQKCKTIQFSYEITVSQFL